MLDAGTGIRSLGSLLDGRPFAGALLPGHLHWDHTQGLPFLTATDHDGAVVELFLPNQEDGDAGVDVLRRAMSPPHFPIQPEGLRGRWSFDLLGEGAHGVAGWNVLALEIPHKGGRTFGYRISDGHNAVAYLSDHGPSGWGPGPDGWGTDHDASMALADGVDVLIHDAQHTAAEPPSVARFGHSAMEYAVALGRRAGVGSVLLFHHDPARTDTQINQCVARRADAGVPASAAAEGETILPRQ